MQNEEIQIENISQLFKDKPEFRNYKHPKKILGFIEFKLVNRFNNIIRIEYVGTNNYKTSNDYGYLLVRPLGCFQIHFNDNTILNMPVSDLYPYFG